MNHSMTAMLLCCVFVQCLPAMAGETPGSGLDLVNASTNQGIVTERYRTRDGWALIQYEQSTNDLPVACASTTNDSRIYVCELWLSQLEIAEREIHAIRVNLTHFHR